MAKKTTGAEGAAAPPFEDALARLEQIVEELEGGALSLEESIARYEEGMKLSRSLTQTLDAAEKRIEKLVEGSDGPETEEAGLDESSPEPSSAVAPPKSARPAAPRKAAESDDDPAGRLPF
jgi:exodeoxyribonuclease VII small subunit